MKTVVFIGREPAKAAPDCVGQQAEAGAKIKGQQSGNYSARKRLGSMRRAMALSRSKP